MKTMDLNSNYDIYVQNGNLAIQRDSLSVIRQTIVNRLSLVKGEYKSDTTLGLNLDIIFGDSYTYNDKIAEIRRVIYLDPNVVSVDKITMTVDTKTRVGYFTCYITVSSGVQTVSTTIGFGV